MKFHTADEVSHSHGRRGPFGGLNPGVCSQQGAHAAHGTLCLAIRVLFANDSMAMQGKSQDCIDCSHFHTVDASWNTVDVGRAHSAVVPRQSAHPQGFRTLEACEALLRRSFAAPAAVGRISPGEPHSAFPVVAQWDPDPEIRTPAWNKNQYLSDIASG